MKLRKLSQVLEMTADQLHNALVEDLVAGVHTDPIDQPPILFVTALRKISEERKVDMERAYQDVRQEAMALGGKPSWFDAPVS